MKKTKIIWMAVLAAMLTLGLALPLWAQQGSSGEKSKRAPQGDPRETSVVIRPEPFPGGIPPRPMPPVPQRAPYVVEKIALDVEIDGQKASCSLKHVIYNPNSGPIEVDYLAPLPEGGAVTGATLFDGKNEMAGNIYDKDKAWEIYRQIVSQMKDPALLEYAGRDTYRARIFPVPAKGRQTLELRFDYLLPKDSGQTAFNFPLAGPLTAGQTLKDVDIHVNVKNVANLSSIYSPVDGVKIQGRDGRRAVATFKQTNAQVLDKFSLYFNSGASPVGGLVLSHKPEKGEDGFFIFLADPSISAVNQEKMAKNVIFVLDRSGSMSGAKFTQAKGALKFVLERLNPEDNFNLVDYNNKINSWQPELMNMSPENRKAALQYVDDLRSGGNTNIEGALKASLKMVADPSMPNYVLFLTDGQPTEGVTDEMGLAKVAKEANSKDAARIFSFGVGYDVNARLLDRLSGQAGGTSVFVNQDENIESKVAAFFSKMTDPVLTKPKLSGNLKTNRVIPENMPDLFAGQQMVVVGRYPRGGAVKFTLSGRVGDKIKDYVFEGNLATGPTSDGQFVAQLWAQRRIGELIDQIDMASGKPSKELVDELVQLSKKYGILTPYTSFLALEDQALTRESELRAVTHSNLSIMDETVGMGANKQRESKANMKTKNVAAPQAASEMAEMAQMDKKVASAGGSSSRNFSAPNQWASKTFFMKNGQWQDSGLSDKDIQNSRRIEQFSDEYFALGKKLRSEEMVWLAQKEPVIFNHSGQNYLIVPAAK